MSHLDRRRFLLASAATAISLRAFAEPATATATLTLHPESLGARVPANFVGLSYETQTLTTPSFLSPANTTLIAQFKRLAPQGVLRIGGNTSDIGWWKPTPDTPRPEIKTHADAAGGEPTSDLAFPITPEAITNLRGFLDATGWTCLYGINLGTNTPARAADEASFVAKTLGDRLEYFQLGNEPDLFFRHLRDPKTWSADKYFDEWLVEANAIRAIVPGARFGLPDTSGNPKWYAIVVDRLASLKAVDRPTIAALSHHYYAFGPPSNPKGTIPFLLHHNDTVDQRAHDISAAAQKLSTTVGATIPYRMTEGNSCYQGGKPGVSDVFAAALWSADYLLTLATAGYAGVNLHGGGGGEVANSLGGKLPGEALMPDPNVPHPRPFYTPIAQIGGKAVAEPVFFGMAFAQQFAGAQMFALDFKPGDINATAYAAKTPTGKTLIAILNKDATALTVNFPAAIAAHVDTLTAASLEAHTVRWSGEGMRNQLIQKRASFTVPAASAMLLTLA